MSILRLLLYVLLGVVAFVVVSAVVSAVLAVFSILWSLVMLVATLAVFGAVGYGIYRLWRLASGGSNAQPQSFDIGEYTSSTSREPVDIEPESRVDRIKDRYANGELSEAEMERLLEREIDTEEYDSIDRELQRERR
jgi:hypothetical protein